MKKSIMVFIITMVVGLLAGVTEFKRTAYADPNARNRSGVQTDSGKNPRQAPPSTPSNKSGSAVIVSPPAGSGQPQSPPNRCGAFYQQATEVSSFCAQLGSNVFQCDFNPLQFFDYLINTRGMICPDRSTLQVDGLEYGFRCAIPRSELAGRRFREDFYDLVQCPAGFIRSECNYVGGFDEYYCRCTP